MDPFPLLAIIAEITLWADFSLLADSAEPGFLLTLVDQIGLYAKVALGIGLVIFVHELGHFAAAKTFGVKCEKFYVGFDIPMPSIGPIKIPSTLGKFRYGETEYGIGILPLGGYVKMLGQDDDPRRLNEEAKAADAAAAVSDDGLDEMPESAPPLDPRSYRAKAVWQRMIIISAGVVMNVITGILFAAIAYGFGVSYTPSLVGRVTPGGPAWQAGLESGGRVVKVGRKSDPYMSFRKMSMEIMTTGLNQPDETIPVTLQYDSGERQYDLRLMSHPFEKDARMIGIGAPMGTRLDQDEPFSPNTAASKVLTDADGGSRITAFNDTPIDPNALIPGTPLADHLYSHPTEAVRLTLEKPPETEGGAPTTRVVSLPPQSAKTLGFGFSTGALAGLIENGPAAKAGLQTGDQLVAVNGVPVGDPFVLATELVGVTEPVNVQVMRGQGNSSQTLDFTLKPSAMVQTQSPSSELTGLIAINRLGLAYRPEPVVRGLGTQDSNEDASGSLQDGDEIRKIKLLTPVKDLPEYVQKRVGDDRQLDELIDGLEFSAKFNLVALDLVLQWLPADTEFELTAIRGESNEVVTAKTILSVDENSYRFIRGIGLPGDEQIRKAEGISDALSLGWTEGKERFTEVIDFLRLAFSRKLQFRHVGGPLSIFKVAKAESEQGISRLLVFLTLLSMNLAILNFLPIPALDGGHMVFLTYELVTGKKPNEAVEYRLTIAGFLLLITLMVSVFAQDIYRSF